MFDKFVEMNRLDDFVELLKAINSGMRCNLCLILRDFMVHSSQIACAMMSHLFFGGLWYNNRP